MKLLIDASLPLIDEAFPSPFSLTRYHDKKELAQLLPQQTALVCRSTLAVNADLLQHSTLRYVATASSGTDHIDNYYLQTQHIQLLDAKGCNAQAVADYVLATIAYLQTQGFDTGKKAGVIGVGAVGSLVFQYLQTLGFEVFGYDPLRTHFQSCAKEALFSCDMLCIHANLHDKAPFASKNLINAAFLAALKPQTIIINAARGAIVNEEDLLNTKNKPIYCTDVYLDEPNINKKICDYATLCTPHIAGHSIEAKNNAIIHISQQLHALLSLTPPDFTSLNTIQEIYFDPMHNPHWQQQILSLYNPSVEIQLLKNATDIQASFLKVRAAHTFRHDFNLVT
jgi:erythronate-4-phosphate dehydrogenase